MPRREPVRGTSVGVPGGRLTLAVTNMRFPAWRPSGDYRCAGRGRLASEPAACSWHPMAVERMAAAHLTPHDTPRLALRQ
jgi:hypothetical protein